MITTKQEKTKALNYTETDENYEALRTILSYVQQQSLDLNIIEDEINDVVFIKNSIENNYFKKSNNLSDLNSITLARNLLDIYSKSTMDIDFLLISNDLNNIQDVNTTLSNLAIGNNALRDVYIVTQINPPNSNDGENGDIWHDWAVLISGD